jgi:hypothetical protein
VSPGAGVDALEEISLLLLSIKPKKLVIISNLKNPKQQTRVLLSSKNKRKLLSNKYTLMIRCYFRMCGETSDQLGAAGSRTVSPNLSTIARKFIHGM